MAQILAHDEWLEYLAAQGDTEAIEAESVADTVDAFVFDSAESFRLWVATRDSVKPLARRIGATAD